MIHVDKVSNALRLLMGRDHWLDSPEDNRRRGFGVGLGGVIASKEAFATAMAEDRALGIYRDGLPVGFLEIRDLGNKTVKCEDFFVAPKNRRQGIGTAAMRQFVDACMERGILRVEYDVPQFNKVAQNFLKHAGFWMEVEKWSALYMDGKDHNMVSFRVLETFWDQDKDGGRNGRGTSTDHQRSEQLENGVLGSGSAIPHPDSVVCDRRDDEQEERLPAVSREVSGESLGGSGGRTPAADGVEEVAGVSPSRGRPDAPVGLTAHLPVP